MKRSEMTDDVRYFEDFKVGDRFYSLGRTITEADLVAFAGISGDYFQLHTNEEFGKRGPYKGRVAHGTLILAATIGLMVQSGLWRENVLSWLGTRELRLTAPVRIGDTVHAEEEVLEKTDKGKDEWGLLIIRHIVKNHRDDKVMEGELVYAIFKRGKSPYAPSGI